MASILAEAVVGKVCEMAVQQVANEVSIVWNFTEDFEWLKNQIEQTNYFLNEADEKNTRQKESVKTWLHRVRDVAWEAEDILQICAVDSMYATNPQFCSLGCSQLIRRHKMGRRIQKIKAQVSSVIEEGNRLNIGHSVVSRIEEAESSSSSQRRQLKRLSLLPSDSKPVGIQSKIDSMVNLLENPQFPIIAVVGMGGMGKTYLLQHVYDAQKGRYEKSAWLSVSQFYSLSKLLSDLAFKLDENLSRRIKESGISEEVAAEEIHSFIQEKRCLIVLDDVWRATREGDLLTRLGIPTGANSQCKILVSTRSREVCVNLHAKIYEMESLTEEDSWKLFCAYAFPQSDGNGAPEYLKEVAMNIVKECGKLPLAIKTTAASLANTTRPGEWQSKFDKLKKVSNPNDPVMDILRLSYDSLPAHLKACFAYLSFFPEDEQIECEYLIYLWLGEGFIPEKENPWDCLDQLANLCLVEVWENISLTKYCKIHDLLLDLAILISRENNFAFGVEDAFCELRSVNNRGGGRWCRLFLAKKDIDERATSERRPVSPTLVRTLSLSCNTKIGGNIPAMFFRGMRVLRVLDLSYTNISTLPACVGKMKLLRVLNLMETKIKMLPKCVRHLRSLTYLNVSTEATIQIPKWISELRCLQHLKGSFERLPKEISKLESLRTLRISGGCWLSLSVEEEEGVLRLEDVGKMSEIEEIKFEVSDEAQLKRMEEGILAPLEKLRRLMVNNAIDGMQGESESDLPQFPERMSAMRDLEHLVLWDFAVPSWICCLANLTYLFLYNCDCSNYPELQALPNLVSLTLWVNKRCRELPKAFGKSGGFPHLRFFVMQDFPELEEFPEMEDGAMACLEKLELRRCEKLNKVGDGLERLKRLKEINLWRSGIDELRETLKEGGIYWKRIKAINPHITVGHNFFDI
ncbi:hypothetical protein SUGI_1111490 [Cryptomeria japonica]|uniref:disease resistance protein RPP8-like n=1 Tax=Cryptomeria japonica TaxID=3369 RepID=UPI002414B6EB|nr:disease resistance protein RPP8-like [Cryptomeria japonica]GLJ52248.1 hypothetical protein SUGI_1111490 [Cryptomeria japonica]